MNSRQLTLFDADTATEYHVNLSIDDYERAITDTEFASQLLLSVQSHGPRANESHDIFDSSSSSTVLEDVKSQWERKHILKLIDLYEQHLPMFKSTTIRNEKVWESISKQIEGFSAEQCKNKVKYLKSKYIKKKENMGPRNTGESPIHFEYFDELDKLFGNKPNVVPVALASSTKVYNKPTEEITKRKRKDDEQTSTSSLKKPRCNKMFNTESVNELKLLMEKRDMEKAKRHEENMKVKNEALQLLRKLTEKYTE